MDFELNEEQKLIKEAASNFANQVLLPTILERDETQTFPTEEIKQLAELGFMGMMVDPSYGGSGLDTMSYVLAMEELSKIDAAASVVMSVNNSLVCWGLEKYGTAEQKEKYLPDLCNGKKIGAFCLSEPEAGSDATSQKTMAVKKGDYYEITGTKNWITNGSSASIYLVIAQTDPEKGSKGISAFINNKGELKKSLEPNEAGIIELNVPFINNKQKNYKIDLIFFTLLFTCIIIFLTFKINDKK